MKSVNIHLVENILGPLVAWCDRDEDMAKYDALDLTDETDIKSILIAEILPYYYKQNDNYKSEFKISLSYYLTTNSCDLDGLLASNLIPSATGGEPSWFFVWMWECLFKDESYILQSPEDYTEINDRYGALIIMRPDLEDYYTNKRNEENQRRNDRSLKTTTTSPFSSLLSRVFRWVPHRPSGPSS